MAERWWRDKAIYQIYPMSFCDSNGDGIGDINGIISKLDYIAALGVGAIWLSPVYPSPWSDNGYDISDYKNVDPRLGTLEDMDRLIAGAAERGMGIIMDLVINHTSDAHEWFQKSRRRIEPYTDYYIWRPARPDGKLPNNWTSFFGEDCWVYDELRGQYYLHMFSKGQADLNYEEPRVVGEIEDVLRFWLDRGVCGFRCDVINILSKNSLADGKKKLILTGSEYYISQEGTHGTLRRLRSDVLDKCGAYTVGETVFVDRAMARDLCGEDRGELDAVFSFEHMECDQVIVKWFKKRFRPKKLFRALDKWQHADIWNTLYFENHDQPRSVSRFGTPEHRESCAKALAVLLLTLKGTPYIFEGQELGMTNFDFTDMDSVRDVESKNIYALLKRLHFPRRLRWRMIARTSRDNARTPMQWSAEEYAGFSTVRPWIDENANKDVINAESESNDANSVLSFYKELLAYKNGSEVLKHGEYKLIMLTDRVYAYSRTLGEAELCIAVNLSAKRAKTGLKGRVVMSNAGISEFTGELAPYEAVIFERQP